jgi:hypothetical protein
MECPYSMELVCIAMTVDFGFLKHPGLIMHKKYKVYYLPHSKEVIMVQESGGNLK